MINGLFDGSAQDMYMLWFVGGKLKLELFKLCNSPNPDAIVN